MTKAQTSSKGSCTKVHPHEKKNIVRRSIFIMKMYVVVAKDLEVGKVNSIIVRYGKFKVKLWLKL